MATPSRQGLIVRDAARYDIALRARFRIGPDHAGIVRFSPGAGAREGWVEADVVDLSSRGLGIMSEVFVPRNCRLDLRVYGAEGEEQIFQIACRVRRVIMTDRRPCYQIGLAFETHDSAAMRQVQALINRLEGGAA